MRAAYLDTSVILRHVLGEPQPYPVDRFAQIYASELARIEALRAIDRLRIQDRWSTEEVATRTRVLTAIMAAIAEVPLQSPILRRTAEPFPTIVRTLDALHIATALLVEIQTRKSLLFVTHDARQGLAAEAAGLAADGFPRKSLR